MLVSIFGQWLAFFRKTFQFAWLYQLIKFISNSKIFTVNIDYFYYSASKLESIRQSGVSGKLKIRQSSTSSNMNLDETQTSIPRINSVGSPSKPHIFYPLIIKTTTLSENYL